MTASTALSVNVNLVAQVRNRRNLGYPSVTRAAEICLQAGAAGITVHPRPDERHIRAHDVADLSALLQAWPGREYNIEGNPFQNLMGFVRQFKPQQCTFVPDSEDQPTSDHGWDLSAPTGHADRLRPPKRLVPTASSCTPSPTPPPGARRARPRCWRSLPPPPAPLKRWAWVSTRATT